MEKTQKMKNNFYVYRSVHDSLSYNTEDKITELLLGRTIIDNYPTLISTTWNLDFSLSWSESSYCCLYVIEVPSNSNYLILKNSFDLKNTQNEITLGPGIIKFDRIAISNVKYKSKSNDFYYKDMFVFFGKYESYKVEDIEEKFDDLICK